MCETTTDLNSGLYAEKKSQKREEIEIQDLVHQKIFLKRNHYYYGREKIYIFISYI